MPFLSQVYNILSSSGNRSTSWNTKQSNLSSLAISIKPEFIITPLLKVPLVTCRQRLIPLCCSKTFPSLHYKYFLELQAGLKVNINIDLLPEDVYKHRDEQGCIYYLPMLYFSGFCYHTILTCNLPQSIFSCFSHKQQICSGLTSTKISLSSSRNGVYIILFRSLSS